MFDKLATEEQRYEELMRLLGTSAVQAEPAEYRKHAKALAEVEPLIERFREYKALVRDVAETEELAAAGDPDMRDLAREELKSLIARRDDLVGEMKILLIPKDPNDEKNVMLEIRAGTGGDEAGLFAAELFRMYSKYAERQGWRVDVMSSNDTGIGGLKEVIATIEGRGAYSKLKYESGVHRVQRVPATEASGRLHTSTVTVAVLPEAEEVDFGVGSAPGPDADVRFTALLSDRMVVVFPAGHPLRQCKSVKLNQLVRVPLVLMTADSSVRKLVDAAFASIGQLIMPAFEATYMSTAAGMVKAGLGVTILPSSAIQMGELAGLVTRPISRPAISRELGVIEKSARSLSPAAEGFLRTIKAAVSAA
jgi:hypothetical protein